MDHQTLSVPQIDYHSPQVSTQPMTGFPQLDSGLAVPVFTQGEYLIACLNKAMAFLSPVAASRITVQQEGMQGLLNVIILKVKDTWLGNALSLRGQGTLYDPTIPNGQAAQTTIPNNAAFQIEDLDAYDSDCDDVSTAQAVLMANLSNYASNVISEVPHSERYHHDMDNQSVHTMQDFEQTPVVDFIDNEITSDSNIIPYSQYLQEKQQVAVQDTNLYTQQESMILFVIGQMSEQMITHVNNWEKANQEKNNESLTAELERYKEREKLALKQQIDSLEQNLSNQIKKKESLLQTFTVFKNESKEKESKYMDKEIDLEKKIKELDNIVYKVGQSAQTKAQLIKPTLYDGSVISSQHAVIPVIDDEETLILEELNQLSKDFGKRFVPQQELSVEQAFWLQTSHPNTDQYDISPIKIEAPRELPKVSVVNTSLKKLKYNLGKFDTVVKKQIIPDGITEGEWGFEHTKAVFLNEIIPFLKTLKDIFNVFDKDHLNEVTEVQTIFNQMEPVVQQCFEIPKKELFS
ncbi:hypothetical protein Tco_1079783 [Tanacetum coccineum]|uniref:Uncharacterized protein n=1 Tax=Tanacetum coccineum TaxID=301880 RepID=A0ABQ5HUV6_9ASTR